MKALGARVAEGITALEEVEAMAEFDSFWPLVGSLLVVGSCPAPLGPGTLAKDIKTGEKVVVLSRNYTAGSVEV